MMTTLNLPPPERILSSTRVEKSLHSPKLAILDGSTTKVEKKCRIHLRKLFRDKFGVTNFEKYNVIGDSKKKKVKPCVAIGDLNDVEEVYNLNSIMQK